MANPNTTWLDLVRPVLLGVLYGVSLRLLFGWKPLSASLVHSLGNTPAAPWIMSIGFLALVPLTVGWLSIARASCAGPTRHARWIFLPWLAILLCDACLLVGHVEGYICVLFSLPITLIMASVGGLLAGYTWRRQLQRRGATTLCLAVLPVLLAAFETTLQAPVEIRTVHTAIRIHAPAQLIWRNIERVPAIQPSELTPTWTHRIGFPLPVEATLDHEGIGGVRHASFQHGLLFIETITAWQPEQRIAFSIAADTAHIPPTTLDEHVTIGGPYFDVLDGEYRLEPLADGSFLLHLSSRERISTDFNRYAALWSDAVMRDLQVSILQVVQHRCESTS